MLEPISDTRSHNSSDHHTFGHTNVGQRFADRYPTSYSANAGNCCRHNCCPDNSSPNDYGESCADIRVSFRGPQGELRHHTCRLPGH
jgi:hypothetical protein